MIEMINAPHDWGTVLENDSDTIIGFKMVRFLHKCTSEADSIAKVRWVQSNFPCAKFVVKIRSATRDQAKSQAKAFSEYDPLSMSAEGPLELNERMRKLETLSGGDQAFVLDSSERTKDLESLKQAVEWLGFDKSCHF
jgi:hypothetical protein